MKNKVKLCLALSIISFANLLAQKPSLNETIDYLNHNITDIRPNLEKIEYNNENNTIKLISISGSYQVINMNKSYEIYLDDNKYWYSAGAGSIKTYHANGEFHQNVDVYYFSNSVEKTVKAIKHLFKLAYTKREKKYKNLKF